MPDKHAVLSASSSSRWLSCPPSAKINASVADKPTEYAMQGTDAHTLCEYKVKSLLGMETADPTENLTYYDEEMEACTDDYANYVVQIVETLKHAGSDPLVLVEQRLDFSDYVPDGFGTGDCVIIADGRLTVIDFKYGTGVLVEAERNSQMLLYALGALKMFDALYDIDTIQMTIFQPRRSNVSKYEISRAELLDWAENTLKPIAKLAANGEGEFKAGNHCRFCKIRATCRTRADYCMELCCDEFRRPAELDDDEIEDALDRAGDIVAWVGDLKEYALKAAMAGKRWSRYKVVEGVARRRFTDKEAVIKTVTALGRDPYKHELLGITDMTKMLGGAKRFNDVLGNLVEKPSGKPTLVSIADKRPEWSSAVEDFKED